MHRRAQEPGISIPAVVLTKNKHTVERSAGMLRKNRLSISLVNSVLDLEWLSAAKFLQGIGLELPRRLA